MLYIYYYYYYRQTNYKGSGREAKDPVASLRPAPATDASPPAQVLNFNIFYIYHVNKF